jgi:L-amino acid N-acyltransferase YncA
MALKELEVRYTERRARPFKLFDGGGLHLIVKPNGTKLWRLKYRMNGRENTLCLGQYPTVSLAAARMKRNEAKVQLSKGIDPAPNAAVELTPAESLTFGHIAQLWHDNRKDGLCEAHADRVWRRMERDVLPLLGEQNIGAITAPEILSVIRQVEARGALDISRRLKQGIGQPSDMLIRLAEARDRPAIAGIIMPTIAAGETYALDSTMSEADALGYWLGSDRETFVAEEDGVVLGTFYLRANQAGDGRHVCNCGYMTGSAATGRGVARRMCEYSIEQARARGFRAMQFNFVVSTNERAVGLWKSLGFATVGRLPEAFQLPSQDYVDALVMHRFL